MNCISTLIQETPQSSLALPLCEDRVRSLQPRIDSSQEPDHAGSLVSDVRPPQLWEPNVCCLEATKSVEFCHSSLKRVGHTVKPISPEPLGSSEGTGHGSCPRGV